MKFAVAKEHRDFFNKNHYVEFENLISSEQSKEILEGINQGLAQRLNLPSFQISKQSPEKQFLSGHDLWRTNDSVKRIVLSNKLAEIAAQLIDQQLLRLGYDQFFPKNVHSNLNPEPPYADLLKNSQTLLDISSLQGIFCGLMICLECPKETQIRNPKEGMVNIFPQQVGSGIFFKPEASIDLQLLAQNDTCQYLLITYVQQKAVYLFRENDPHTHFLKSLGHVFGDRLSDKWHPIVFR